MLYCNIVGLFPWILKDYEQPLPKAKERFYRWDSKSVKRAVFSGALALRPEGARAEPEKLVLRWLSVLLHDTCTTRAEPSPIPWKLKESSTITIGKSLIFHRHPCYSQLTAFKIKYPLISIMSSYRGRSFRARGPTEDWIARSGYWYYSGGKGGGTYEDNFSAQINAWCVACFSSKIFLA